jgi:hypothetical protein
MVMSPGVLGPANDSLARASSNCKRQTLHKDYDRKGSVEKKVLVVSLKRLGIMTN